jgi:hypothetical protein
MVDSGEGPEPPNQGPDLHDYLAAVPLQWVVVRQRVGHVPLGGGLQQQHHKPVFKPCLDRGNRYPSERASLWRTAMTLSVLRLDEPYATTLWHRVNHTRVVEQARLQSAGWLPRAGLGQERAAGR